MLRIVYFLLCSVVTTTLAVCASNTCPGRVSSEQLQNNAAEMCSSKPRTSTSTLLIFDFQSSCNYYSVMYKKKSSDSDREVTNLCINSDSVILVSLTPNTVYEADVCAFVNVPDSDAGNIGCCRLNFMTDFNANLVNQVGNVRAHVFYPMLKSDVVSAQIVWEALDDDPIAYDVIIKIADRSMTNVMGGQFLNLPPQDTFVNVLDETSEIPYPLQAERLYIVEVRGKNATMNYSFSEPIWIDTRADTSIETDYLLLNNDKPRLSVLTANNVLITPTQIGIYRPIAVDKRYRNIFYLKEEARTIFKSNIDAPFLEDEFYTLTEPGPIIASMSYDWLGNRLYIGLITETEDNQFQIMFCYLLDVTLRQRHLECLPVAARTQNNGVPQIDMTVNPILGIIYWTWNVNGFNLNVFNLNTNSKTLDVASAHDLSSTAIAEDIQNDCLYVVSNDKLKCLAQDKIKITRQIPIDNTIVVDFIVANTDGGVYMTTASSIEYLDSSDDNQLIRTLINVPLWFDTTNPNTQPLPEKACLTPVISTSQLSIEERTTTSFYLTWNTSNLTYHENCKTQPFSHPPLVYRIIITQAMNIKRSIIDMEQQQYDTSLNVTSINPSLRYSVIVGAKTNFTSSFTPIISTTIESLLTAEDSITSTSLTTMTTGSATRLTNSTSSTGSDSSTSLTSTYRALAPTSTSSTGSDSSTSLTSINHTTPTNSGSSTKTVATSLTRTISSTSIVITGSTRMTSITDTKTSITEVLSTIVPPSRGSDSVAIAAGISGGVVLVIILIVITIAIIIAIICFRSNKKIYTMNSESARYVRREKNVSDDNQLGHLSPYESPLTLSTPGHPLLISSMTLPTQDQQNGVNPAPYAIPADSLQQYRSSQLMQSRGQEYEVPISQTNTLSNNVNRSNSDNSQPPINVYSTLNDAVIEKESFNHSGQSRTTPDINQQTIPPNYTSLFRGTMEEPHSYAVHSSSSPITIAPEIYSEPIMSPIRSGGNKRSPPIGGVKRTSKDGIVFDSKNNSTKGFDNPVYESEPSSNGRYNLNSSSIDSRNQPRSNSKSHSGSNNQEPAYFLLERPKAADIPHQTNATDFEEPTYFELEKRNNSTDHTKSVTNPEPTYFELERSSSSGTDNNSQQPRSDNLVPDPEPTYSEVGKPTKQDPLYFQLENKQRDIIIENSNAGASPQPPAAIVNSQ